MLTKTFTCDQCKQVIETDKIRYQLSHLPMVAVVKDGASRYKGSSQDELHFCSIKHLTDFTAAVFSEADQVEEEEHGS